ncbi:hypothetical protein N0V90_002124 [Kalmusia sp. IMI 367209]|nr:hypothetical protein N0V90_002124 [Kalmusia sp. IMI 367209]
MKIPFFRWRHRSKASKSGTNIRLAPEASGDTTPTNSDIGEVKRSLDDAGVENTYEASVKIPTWFLENCVVTADELKSRTIPLVLRNSQSASTESTTEAPNRSFEMEHVVYEALHVALRKNGDKRGQLNSKAPEFQRNKISLLIPNQRSSRGASTFFQAIVEHFAKEIGAHLITLSIDDLEDLAEHFTALAGKPDERVADYVRRCFADDEPADTGFTSKATNLVKKLRTKPEFPFREIIQAPIAKSKEQGIQGQTASRRPIIIHIPEAHIYNSYTSYTRRYREYGDFKSDIVIHLGTFVTTQFANKVLLISSSNDSGAFEDNIEAIIVAPLKTEEQMNLLQNGTESTKAFEEKNTRLLQRMLRQKMKGISQPLSEPYAKWGFLEEAQSKTFGTRFLAIQEAEFLAEHIGEKFDGDDIIQAISGVERRTELLQDWDEKPEGDNKWSRFPEKAQKAIRDVEQNSREYKWEQQFLSLLVDPASVEEGWSDIQLDLETKETIMQMVDQPVNTGRTAYGILSKGRIGGALLYGPPGTGKTHLARVLARECQATMISASAADIENMYVGETEKAIKGLFNLGRMLAPSIIFIDEADSLFHARGPGDRSWERSRTNQLLTEMDGLVKMKTPPFVLLATNFPRQLDHAVLRRTPSRLHIGLPSPEGREKIFHICMRDETVSDDVDWEELSRKTKGFSGSDIQTICVQAALICQASPADINADGVRTLRREHFEKALQRSAPTVSGTALSQIREFAKEFDPGTWAKMRADAEMQNRKAEEAEMRRAVVDSARKAKEDGILPNTAAGTEQSAALDSLSYPRPPEQPMKRTVHTPNWPPSAWSYSRPAFDSTGRIEELESDGEEEANDASNEKTFEYVPLAMDSREIRVLSIEAISNDGDQPLRCTLENVSLEDWTPLHRFTMEKLEKETIKNEWLRGQTHDKLLVWQIANIIFHRRKNGQTKLKHDTPENIGHQLLEELITPMQANYDIPMEDMEALEPRYNWGDYIALSYVWGDPQKSREIYVNGQRFPVGENLYLALRKLQKSFEVRERKLKIWIDAICINQNDHVERAQEVKKMEMIYSEAIAVRGWVGVPPPTTIPTFHIAREWLDRIRELQLRDVVADLVPDEQTARALWTLASTLFYEPYWQRLWIMQEIALAPALLFWYGDWYFTTAELSKLYHLFSDGGLGLTFTAAFGGTSSVIKFTSYCAVIFSRLVRLRRWEHEYEKAALPLTDVIHLAQSAAATDPRDKVYGLLAILPKGIAARIQPSYQPDVRVPNVYTSFAKASFLEEGNLNSLARLNITPMGLDGLPSWAFDLSSDAPHTLMLTRHKRHAANGPRTSVPTFSDDGMVMSCEGVFIDTIETLSAALHQGKTEVWEPIEPPIDPISADTGPYLIPVDETRVLWHDSNYDFSQGPSLLDVPWIPVDEVPTLHNSKVYVAMVPQDAYQRDDVKQWPTFIQMSPLNIVVRSLLYPNAIFPIHGIALRHYFTNFDSLCPDPVAFHEMGKDATGVVADRRLCTTKNGLLGMAPKYAKLGDRIAVLTGCDMPVVLRPKGDNFEFIGAAFVEGLMKGEAIERVEKGGLELGTIAIC